MEITRLLLLLLTLRPISLDGSSYISWCSFLYFMMLLPVVRDIGNLLWPSRKGENEVASSRDTSPSEGLGEASMTGRASKGHGRKRPTSWEVSQ